MEKYKKVFESENIYYIKLNKTLIEEYLKMVNDPEVSNKISHNPKTFTYEKELNWININLENNALIFSMIEKKTNERIERQKQTIREKNNTYGIYVDGKLVGYSSYGPARDENYKDSCEVYSCYILEEYQRLHLGRKVVMKILEDFIQEGYKTMITKCLVGNPANKFHEAIGGEFRNHTEIDLLGERFLENVYYHEDIKKSLKLNQEKEEKFYLEEPSLERKEDAIEYMEEFIKYNSETAGDSGLDTGYKNYEKWLEYIESLKKPETCPSNRCLGLEWFLIRESDNKIVGPVNLRWNLNDWMMQYGGHIGYEVRPTAKLIEKEPGKYVELDISYGTTDTIHALCSLEAKTKLQFYPFITSDRTQEVIELGNNDEMLSMNNLALRLTNHNFMLDLAEELKKEEQDRTTRSNNAKKLLKTRLKEKK